MRCRPQTTRRLEPRRLLPPGRPPRLTYPPLDAARLRACLATPDPPDPNVGDPTTSAAAWTDESPHPDLKEAAVLVAITTGATPGVLLTRRSPNLRHHPGQVSFPGGRIDPEDPTPEAAALREAQEEIGLLPEEVELVGRLSHYVTGTGFRITPVVGLVRAYTPLLSLGEVAAIFELPLTTLLDPTAPQQRRAGERLFWVWPHPDHEIWGATAAILVHLATRLRRAEALPLHSAGAGRPQTPGLDTITSRPTGTS